MSAGPLRLFRTEPHSTEMTGLRLPTAVVVCALGLFAAGSQSQTLQVLHSFVPAGASPYSGLIQLSDGRFYGTTSQGGVTDSGMIFSIGPGESRPQVLHVFGIHGMVDGSFPAAGLIEATNGYLYGTTRSGGALLPFGPAEGVVFRISRSGDEYEVLYSFQGGAGNPSAPEDGASPYGTLTQGKDGNLYGTTYAGGAHQSGTVFRIGLDGSGYKIVHSFDPAPLSDGANPYAGLLQFSDGMLYGTTVNGGSNGSGTVFRIATDGSALQILHSFGSSSATDGANPKAGLFQASDGSLYGTTSKGGAYGFGTIFRITPSTGAFELIHSFLSTDPNDGATPYAPLLQGPDGYLYGTTSGNGANPWGNVFKIKTDGTGQRTLHSFVFYDRQDGATPYSGLIQGSDGALYGTTLGGGACYKGVVYKIQPDGTEYETMYSFGVNDGILPSVSLLLGSDGNLYGTTRAGGGHGDSGGLGDGTIYKIGTDGKSFEVLHSFNHEDRNDGTYPLSGLIEASDGNLYGTTDGGGPRYDAGTAYKIARDGSGFQILWPIASDPNGRLVQAADGNLYGIALRGVSGAYVFALSLSGSFRVVAPLNTWATAEPFYDFALIAGRDGKLYGALGGVFSVGLDGSYQLMNPQAASSAPLVQASDGSLFGTTSDQGSYLAGTVFRVQPDGGGFQVLHSFDPTDPQDGRNPYSELIVGQDGYLYGTTSGGGSSVTACSCAGFGTVFRIAPDGTGFRVIYSFSNLDGARPTGGMVQAASGDLYGTTEGGGAYDAGTVFRLTGSVRPSPVVLRRPEETRTVPPR